jgi:type I restriction enzyme S subunit
MKGEEKRLKRLFVSAVGGSWGTEPGGGDLDALCIRGTDFDTARLRVETSRAPTRGFTSDDIRSRGAVSGDLIIEKSGGGEQQPVGRAVLWDGADLVMPTNFAARLRVNAQTDARFATYLLASMWSDGRTRAAIKQTTGIQNLDLAALLDQRVSCPPLPLQRAIADYLDRETARIDALIGAKQRIVELLKERFVRFVQSLVDPNAPSAQGRLIPLKYMTKIERGVFSHRPRNDPAFYDGSHPFIQTGDVARARKYVESWTQTLNDRGLAVSRKFPAGTLTMVIAANIGDVGITTFEACFPDSVVGIKTNASILDSNYLYFGLLAAKERLVEMAPVTTQANLNVERIGSLVIRCPSLADQHMIANRFDDELQRVDLVVGREERSIELLRERRQALITGAVTGQLDIPEAA